MEKRPDDSNLTAKTPHGAGMIDQTVRNLLEALGVLKDRGYKIAKSKLYQDKDRGLIRVNADGSVPMSEIDAYITRAALKLKPERVKDVEKYQSKKIEAELRNEKLRGDKLEIEVKKLRGELIEKRDAEERTAEMIGLMDAAPRRLMLLNVVEYVQLVGGDPGKAAIMRNKFDADLDEFVDQLSKTDGIEIEVGS